ncbi:MAG: iron-sulfur cluster assembly accessory protein [Novosphingobium sp.]
MTTVTRPHPAAVVLTPAAEARIAKLMSMAPEGTIGVKLSTPQRGCSGLAYSVDYVTEEARFDEKIETPGGIFYIDSASVLYLVGSTMDWQEDDFTAGFVFDNPNA